MLKGSLIFLLIAFSFSISSGTHVIPGPCLIPENNIVGYDAIPPPELGISPFRSRAMYRSTTKGGDHWVRLSKFIVAQLQYLLYKSKIVFIPQRETQ
ncbi:hypothetical protein KSF_056740 [Reticulibacter mediterranei]|uniref:Uncharacterized protein n=1 Tax=Reticulibacter mediterranei TaxID=2778369 RepID=A0A8J3ISX2_9CHLR|nr:hypothetical protein KSF_056740 [Reticulibacter mediterranei]